jgi:CheY-like chemotaxis protein
LIQPINASRLFLTALKQRELPEEHQTLVEHLANSQQTAENLIHELLEIAKIDAGAMAVSIDVFPVDILLDSLSKDYQALAHQRGLTFTKHPCRLVVRSDNTLLRRILQNLLANALRYTRRGRVVLGCRRQNNALRIEVWDTGPGIASEYFGEIFTEFKRLNSHKNPEGLGLGLATVQRLCGLLDHPINVKSQVGKGSVFSVTVPLGRIDAQSDGISPLNEINSVISQPLLGLRVLCLDNDSSILTGMEAMLSDWGCHVTACRSEQQVWASVDNDKLPDVILADYHLTGEQTGIAVVLGLFEQWHVQKPCIVISADRTDTVKQQAQQHGFLFLQKPLKTAALRAGLSRFAVGRQFC